MNRLCLFLGILLPTLILCSKISASQTRLKPGFDPNEYRQLIEVSSRQLDTALWSEYVTFPFPENCKLVYRSDSVGLNNRWDLWLRSDSVGIISIRGTIMRGNSWAEDFYASMVPAKGSIIIDNDYVFLYKLAEDSKASVHIGWLTAVAYLSPSIISKLNEYSAYGIKDYIIVGHSQGGAVAYLLTSYLHYLDKERIPAGLTFKTYCSAPPKPGNWKYAYDFDFITRGGWALRVYNSEDWVPETPISVQTLYDFSSVNPYSERDSIISKMSLFEEIVFKHMVNETKDHLDDSRDLLINYFGKTIYKHMISKYLPEFPEPEYSKDMFYYPCGVPVVLMASSDYEDYIKTETSVPLLFKNHLFGPYYYLLNKIYFGK